MTSYTIPGLTPDTTYYVAVTAYDTSYNPANDDPSTIVNENQTNGNESWYAEEKEGIPLRDSDGDGMPDDWETQYGLDPNDPTDADYDNDNDLLANLQEYQLGTNPGVPDQPECSIIRPVRTIGTPNALYSTLQSAYNPAKDNATIQSHNTTFTEDLNINLNKTVTLQGGYDCGYATVTGKTTVNGNMTISNGILTIENFILQ